MKLTGAASAMASPQRTSIDHINGWRGLRLTAGDVSLVITPDIGGRIMSLTFRGEELFYVHTDEAGVPFDLSGIEDLAVFKAGFGFRLFGGDKTWVAPEQDWLHRSPPVDLDAGRYALEQRDGTCVMTSPVCRETGLAVVRRVRLEDNGTVRLEEEFLNTTGCPLLKGIWNVTQIVRPFDVYLPADPSAIRSYYLEDPTLPDPGQVVEPQGDWSRIRCRSSVCFKFGGIPRAGRVFVVRPSGDGSLAFAREFELSAGGQYAHRSAVEVFNSSRFPYGELELHAPLRPIPPGGAERFRQSWRLRWFPRGIGPEEMAEDIFPFDAVLQG